MDSSNGLIPLNTRNEDESIKDESKEEVKLQKVNSDAGKSK